MDNFERLLANGTSLADFLNQAPARVTLDLNTLTQMTAEEERAMREEILHNFNSESTATAATTTESSTTPSSSGSFYEDLVREMNGQEQESAPEPQLPPIPINEAPIEVPDYSNVREETLRFSGAEWFAKIQEKVIVLAGVGGIGSWCALLIGKLYPKALYIFDADTVESYNIAGQFYSTEDIGQMKVDAVARGVIRYTNFSSIFTCPRRYRRGEEIVSDIMICGFDRMSARREFYYSWKSHVQSKPENERKKCLFIDGRLSMEELQILCMTGEDTYYMEQYEKRFLFSDYESEHVVCSAKQTGFLANMVGSMMVNLLVNFCANEVRAVGHAALPFFTKYRYDTMFVDMEK